MVVEIDRIQALAGLLGDDDDDDDDDDLFGSVQDRKQLFEKPRQDGHAMQHQQHQQQQQRQSMDGQPLRRHSTAFPASSSSPSVKAMAATTAMIKTFPYATNTTSTTNNTANTTNNDDAATAANQPAKQPSPLRPFKNASPIPVATAYNMNTNAASAATPPPRRQSSLATAKQQVLQPSSSQVTPQLRVQVPPYQEPHHSQDHQHQHHPSPDQHQQQHQQQHQNQNQNQNDGSLIFGNPKTFGAAGGDTDDGTTHIPNVRERASAINQWKIWEAKNNNRNKNGHARAMQWRSASSDVCYHEDPVPSDVGNCIGGSSNGSGGAGGALGAFIHNENQNYHHGHANNNNNNNINNNNNNNNNISSSSTSICTPMSTKSKKSTRTRAPPSFLSHFEQHPQQQDDDDDDDDENSNNGVIMASVSPRNNNKMMMASPRNNKMMASPRNNKMMVSPRNNKMIVSPRNNKMIVSPRNNKMIVSPRNKVMSSPRNIIMPSPRNNGNNYASKNKKHTPLAANNNNNNNGNKPSFLSHYESDTNNDNELAQLAMKESSLVVINPSPRKKQRTPRNYNMQQQFFASSNNNNTNNTIDNTNSTSSSGGWVLPSPKNSCIGNSNVFVDNAVVGVGAGVDVDVDGSGYLEKQKKMMQVKMNILDNDDVDEQIEKDAVPTDEHKNGSHSYTTSNENDSTNSHLNDIMDEASKFVTIGCQTDPDDDESQNQWSEGHYKHITDDECDDELMCAKELAQALDRLLHLDSETPLATTAQSMTHDEEEDYGAVEEKDGGGGGGGEAQVNSSIATQTPRDTTRRNEFRTDDNMVIEEEGIASPKSYVDIDDDARGSLSQVSNNGDSTSPNGNATDAMFPSRFGGEENPKHETRVAPPLPEVGVADFQSFESLSMNQTQSLESTSESNTNAEEHFFAGAFATTSPAPRTQPNASKKTKALIIDTSPAPNYEKKQTKINICIGGAPKFHLDNNEPESSKNEELFYFYQESPRCGDDTRLLGSQMFPMSPMAATMTKDGTAATPVGESGIMKETPKKLIPSTPGFGRKLNLKGFVNNALPAKREHSDEGLLAEAHCTEMDANVFDAFDIDNFNFNYPENQASEFFFVRAPSPSHVAEKVKTTPRKKFTHTPLMFGPSAIAAAAAAGGSPFKHDMMLSNAVETDEEAAVAPVVGSAKKSRNFLRRIKTPLGRKKKNRHESLNDSLLGLGRDEC